MVKEAITVAVVAVVAIATIVTSVVAMVAVEAVVAVVEVVVVAVAVVIVITTTAGAIRVAMTDSAVEVVAAVPSASLTSSMLRTSTGL